VAPVAPSVYESAAIAHGDTGGNDRHSRGTEGHVATLFVLIAVCVALEYVVARPWVVAVAVCAVIAFYVGLDSGWWGNGTGDGWQFARLLMVAVTDAVTVAAAVLGRTRRR
jgi:hypothetical protein